MPTSKLWSDDVELRGGPLCGLRLTTGQTLGLFLELPYGPCPIAGPLGHARYTWKGAVRNVRGSEPIRVLEHIGDVVLYP